MRGDDVELVGEPLLVVGAREAVGAAAPRRDARPGPPRPGAQLGGLGGERSSSLAPSSRGDEARQDRLAAVRAEGAALGDLDGVVERLGEVGEQLRHLLGALEVVLARDAAAVVLDDVAALGDAQQRVVRLVVVGRGEVGLVGGDERKRVA